MQPKAKPAAKADAEPRFRLNAFEVADFKRVRLVSCTLDPASHALVIGGNNEQGKSSVIDGIYAALCGKTAQPPKPVREGEHHAEVKLDLGALNVHLTVKPDGARTLEVRAADGAPVKRAQELLDSIVGQLAFDPVAFTRYEAAKQYELVRELVGLTFDDLDREENAAAASRADAHKAVKELEARIAALPAPTAGLPESEQDPADLAARIASATQSNYTARAEERNVLTLKAEIADLEQRLQDSRARLAKGEEALAKARAAVVDPKPLEEQLRTITETNKAVRANVERKALAAKLKTARADAQDFEQQVEEVRATRKQRLAAAKFPVEGLSFAVDPTSGKAGLTLKGVPFGQASSAEKLRAAFAIVRAMNPRLRLCFIRDGSLLDDHSLAAVVQAATEWDGQVIVETVGRRPEASLIIEDGAQATK